MGGDIELVSTVPGSDDGDEDVLEAGAQRLSQRVVWSLLLVLAVAAGTAWFANRPGTPRPTATVPDGAPSRTPNQSPPGDPPIRDLSCPGASLCVISTITPHQVSRAVRHYDPRVSSVAVRSIVRQGGSVGYGPLRSRQVEANVGAAKLLIRVGQYRHAMVWPGAPLSPTPPGLASVLLHSESAGYVIDLQWIGPGTALPRVDRLRALATDPRLEALS